MFRLTIRNLVTKRLRLLAVLTAIVLGVAFTTGTMILADTMSASFHSAVDDVGDGVDVVARGNLIGQADLVTARAPLPADHVDRIREVDGVAAVAPYYEGYAEVIGPDGKVLDIRGSVGLAWVDDRDLSMFEIIDGRQPTRPGTIALGANAADEAGAVPGSRVDVMTAAGRETMTVTGIAAMTGGADLGDIGFVFFTAQDAATRLAPPGSVDEILVRGESTVTQTDLAASVAMAIPDADVVTGAEQVAEQQGEIDDVIAVLETVLLVFGGVALFVGSFTIANTFTITLAHRTNELALTRALGASRRQLRRAVLTEALVIGTIGAGAGLAAGLGIAEALTALFAAIGLQFPARSLVVAPSTVIVAAVSGLLVTVGASLLPARRAGRIAPVAAMREASMEPAALPLRRKRNGNLLAAAALTATAVGTASDEAGLIGLGAVAVFIASVVLGPVLIRPVTRVLSAPVRRLGLPSKLAAANAVRNPRRAAATAAALTIGVTLVSGASLFASTARATIVGDTTSAIQADRVLHPAGSAPGIPPGVTAELAAMPDVRSERVQITLARVGDEITDVAGIDLVEAAGLVNLPVLDGELDSAPGHVVVGDEFAAEHDWTTGDPLEIVFTDGATERFTIVAVVEQTEAFPPVFLSYDSVARHGDGLDAFVLLDADPDGLALAEAALADLPTARLDTVEGFAQTRAAELDALLTLVVGFLGLAVLIAVLGIGTTIGLSVHERRRELGILRAVGLTRRQLRRTVRVEAILIAMFGTVVGMSMGLGLTAALLATMADQGFDSPVVPTSGLVAIAVGSIIAGTASAALPARRAARLPVLDAVRSA